MNKIIEYIDNNDNYKYPERKTENEILEIRLYCNVEGCNKYIKGTEGYNGSFTTETGYQIDLRNQCFICNGHIENYRKTLIL